MVNVGVVKVIQNAKIPRALTWHTSQKQTLTFYENKRDWPICKTDYVDHIHIMLFGHRADENNKNIISEFVGIFIRGARPKSIKTFATPNWMKIPFHWNVEKLDLPINAAVDKTINM